MNSSPLLKTSSTINETWEWGIALFDNSERQEDNSKKTIESTAYPDSKVWEAKF